MNPQNLSDYLSSDSKANLIVISAPEDSYALSDYLITAFRPPEARRYKFIADRYFDFKDVNDILNSGSLFDDKTYIEINYKTKPTAPHQKELINLVKELPPSTYIIITTDKLTKTDYNAPWMKLDIAWYISINDNSTIAIVKHILKANNLSINTQALNLLLELNGQNSNQLVQEINKLSLLFESGHQISTDDIKTHGLDNALYSVYQLNNAYLLGNLKQALTILSNIYIKPEDAILILWLLNDDIKKLIRLKSKLQQKYSFSEVAGELKIWSTNNHLYQNALGRLSYTVLVSILDDIAMLDMAIKGLIDKDVQLQLIAILTKLCSK